MDYITSLSHLIYAFTDAAGVFFQDLLWDAMAVGGGGQSVEALVGYFGWGGKYEALLQWRTTVLAFKC